MKTVMRIFAVVLAAACVFSLMTGVGDLKQVMGAKDYWTAASGGSDSLGQLEAGIKQLVENKPAYDEGLATYNDGLKTIEESEKALAEGEQTIKESEELLAEGAHTISHNWHALWNANEEKIRGEATLASVENALNSMVSDPTDASEVGGVVQTAVSAAQNVEGFTATYAANGASNPEAAAVTTVAIGSVQQKGGLSGVTSTQIAEYATTGTVYTHDTESGQITGVDAATTGTISGTLEATGAVNTVKTAVGINGKLKENLPADDYALIAANSTNPAAASTIGGKALGFIQKSHNDISDAIYKIGTSGEQLKAAEKMLEEKTAELEAGKQQLEDGKKQLAEGKEKLADGKKQLSVFEDGIDTLAAGLETAMGTATYMNADGTEAVPSIKTRLGEGFNFFTDETMLNGNKLVDLDKAQEVLDAAKAFAADLTAAVTTEITTRAGVDAVIAIAGVLGLLAAIFGLLGKKGLTKIFAIITAIAGALGIAGTSAVGTTFADVAGAAAPNGLLAAGAITAAAAIMTVITFFVKKAPKVTE